MSAIWAKAGDPNTLTSRGSTSFSNTQVIDVDCLTLATGSLRWLSRASPTIAPPGWLARYPEIAAQHGHNRIREGDVLVGVLDVRNRQIIVARLENEVTVKRYRQEGSVVWLLPENPDFEPIRVDLRKQSMTIEGVVVGVLRRGRADVMQ